MITYDFKGKTAVVTGARRGIGRAIALKLAAAGARTAVTDIDLEACESVAKSIRDAGGEGIALHMDISSEQEVAAAVDEVQQRYGRLDILVNNAGIYLAGELNTMDSAAIDRTIAVNLRGAILCIKHAMPGMMQRNYGKIVTVSSIAGIVGYPQSTVYSATKGGLVALTKELALNLGRYRINVNAVAPGVIETAMSGDVLNNASMKAAILEKVPYGRIGKPEDIANGVAFLASDDSDYITGEVLVIDGGWLAS